MKTNYGKIMGQVNTVCFALCMLICPNQSRAQFSANFQTNIISGFATNYSPYTVGLNTSFDALFILNGGSLTSIGQQFIGYESGANSNLVVVSDRGSAWTTGSFYVGYHGAGNRLVISNGGTVVNSTSSTSVGLHRNHNSVLVTGDGSVWNTRNLYMGDGGAYCSMVVSNGGSVSSSIGFVGGNIDVGGRSNTVIVTGAGSVWSNTSRLNIGYMNRGNTLIVSNGGAVFNADLGIIGTLESAGDNRVLVTGSGSVWRSSTTLLVGWGSGDGTRATNNQLTVADGGLVLASGAVVGVTPNANNSLIHVAGGNLTITNLSATNGLNIRRGRLVLDSGTVTADQLWMTNGINSIVEFNGGILNSKGTFVSNPQPFVVGDAIASGNFHLLGGLHSFQNGLRIRTNSFLTGCGTINGSMVIDAGGVVRVDCTNLVFTSSVTNNGAMVIDGGVLEAFGLLVNNGTIFLLNGGTTNFHGTFINNGAILSGDVSLSTARDGNGGLFVRHIGAPTVTYRLQRATSATGPWSNIATNTARASGIMEYHETNLPPGQSFYRTVQQ